MDKHRVGSVVLLGMFITSMSGLAMAANGKGGHGGDGGRGGYSGHGGYGGYRGYGGHSNVGVRIVVDPFMFVPGYYPRPYYYAPYYYPPYYYPPSVVNVPSTPPVYIEREAAAEPAPQSSASWYYCADPKGYYPYVEQCRGGWQAVAPRPPDAPDEGR